MRRLIYAMAWLAFVFLTASCAVHSQSSMQLQPLGEVVIPYNYSFNDTPVGGLSGLAYSPVSDTYYVISDDRSELAPARAYSFTVKLDEKEQLTEKSIDLKEVIFLKTLEGKRYKSGTVDPEGIAIEPDSLIYVTSEGGRKNGESPFINAYDKHGAFVKSFPIPSTYWTTEKEDRSSQGIRTNLAFESLTLTPDGKTLYAATENALIQDGPVADTASISPSRIIVYDVQTEKVVRQYCYDVDKVHMKSAERGPFAVNGLSDLMALDNEGRLLSLDRNYVQGQGNHILLYEVTTAGATDIDGMLAMTQSKQTIQPVKKKLIADLSEYNITIDNFEGLVLGPKLPGGGQLLLIVSDNNFSDTQQTLFSAFRLTLN